MNPAGPKVLLVEDSKAVRRSLAGILTDMGVPDSHIREAADARAAMEVFRAFRPDLVFLDIELVPDPDRGERNGRNGLPNDGRPVADGDAIALEMVAERPGTKVVIVSAFDGSDPRLKRVLARGIHSVLPKPVRPSDVREILASWK
ncbi:MAG TPA: response regulator [Thermoplasmata archaeon]|nr:response regulator [Thermoplasmata archaeon]